MVVAAIVGYLIGSLPIAVWVGRTKHIDPRTRGDGNPGWWNSRSVLGERAAALIAILDIAKGAVAAAVGGLIWGPWWTAFIAAFAAMVGHAFPLFAGGRGGKSILTFVGAVLVLATTPALIAIAAGLVVAVALRKFEYGARLAMFAFPFVQLFFDPFTHVIWSIVMMMFIGLRFAVSSSPAPAKHASA